MESKFYGLTSQDVRRMAYELAARNKIKHPFSPSGAAGRAWIDLFLKRHPELSIRKPTEQEAAKRGITVGIENLKTTALLLTLTNHPALKIGSSLSISINLHALKPHAKIMCQSELRRLTKKKSKALTQKLTTHYNKGIRFTFHRLTYLQFQTQSAKKLTEDVSSLAHLRPSLLKLPLAIRGHVAFLQKPVLPGDSFEGLVSD
ncbi:unnamed protein product, partial [Acanthoscelides obtectus]